MFAKSAISLLSTVALSALSVLPTAGVAHAEAVVCGCPVTAGNGGVIGSISSAGKDVLLTAADGLVEGKPGLEVYPSSMITTGVSSGAVVAMVSGCSVSMGTSSLLQFEQRDGRICPQVTKTEVLAVEDEVPSDLAAQASRLAAGQTVTTAGYTVAATGIVVPNIVMAVSVAGLVTITIGGVIAYSYQRDPVSVQ